jgi:F-type H+-transporting ATPase subunit c
MRKFTLLFVLILPNLALASTSDNSVYAISAVFGAALAIIAGTMSQSKAAAAALEGIARNPAAADKLFVPMLLSLAFIESLVLFGWLLAFLQQTKIV